MQKIKDVFKSCPEVLHFLLFLLGGVAVVFLTNHCFGVFAPFIIAYVITRILRPLMVKINNKIKLPKIITTLLCLLIFVIVAGLIIWFLLYNVVDGIEYLIGAISDANITDWIQAAETKLSELSTVLPLHIDLNSVSEIITDLSKSLIKELSGISIDIIVSLPEFLVAFIIGSIAAFYMLYDYENISTFIKKQLSPKTQKVLNIFNYNVLFSLFKMGFSYVIISMVCLLELGIGFFILGIHDAWFVAFIIAIVDVFPILGSGTILVPWSVIAIVMGNPVRGIGLLIIWGVIAVVRQILESKIVGSQIGLHSLLTLMALYLGLQLMGAVGLIVGPLYVILCKKLNEAGIIHLYI